MSFHDSCPRCGAKNDEEAQKMCRPGVDECPVADYPTLEEGVAALNTLIAQWEQSEEAHIAACLDDGVYEDQHYRAVLGDQA